MERDGSRCLSSRKGQAHPHMAPGEFSDTISTHYALERRCAGGSYGTGPSACQPCPAGKYCPPGTTAPKECPAGYYCPLGSSHPWDTPCPANTSSSQLNLDSANQCVKCKPTEYCPPGTVTPYACPEDGPPPGSGINCSPAAVGLSCPLGEYLKNRVCYKCKKGYTCEVRGMTEEEMLESPCPAGYTCPEEAMTQGRKYPCPAGSYCPDGTSDSKGIPCPPGTYNKETHAEDVDRCLQLRAGVYSKGGAKSEDGEGSCNKGYYCPAGSGSPNAVPCPKGTYRDTKGAGQLQDCSPCAAGTYCNSLALTAPVQCPAGKYCLGGSEEPEPCPVGTTREDEGGTRASDCAPCPAGKFCDLVGAREPAGECEEGFLCKSGASVSTPFDGTTGSLCPLGYYCGRGAAKASICLAGTYTPFAGAKSEADCVKCKKGYFCEGPTSNDVQQECPPGKFCEEGASAGKPAPEGHYATGKSIGPTACAPGTYQGQEGQTTCVACDAGRYCPRMAMTAPEECGAGHYCPAGSTAPQKCPEGTFTAATTLVSADQCTLCSAGHYCPTAGASKPAGQCAAGYYCKEGSRSAMPDEKTGNFGPCVEGQYCVAGATEPALCPTGTYGPSKLATKSDACIKCDAGRYALGSSVFPETYPASL
ncbi:gcc2 and gcc3 domain-containing protein [Cystoisospora suis]|uniref:Gcc2 and gcc3 domain-containing protein n=1 Tax=Cystoisospora suis TaxID=483139 RepID=A0A2C6LCU0_9APIC|nr:gcc2 and gcc3 domain-containing protein [Cystoisospora suis]